MSGANVTEPQWFKDIIGIDSLPFSTPEVGSKVPNKCGLIYEMTHHFVCHLEFPNPRKSSRLLMSMS